MLKVEHAGQRGHTAMATDSGRNGTKPSPAPLQKHSLGDPTCQAGAVRQRRLGRLKYPTTAVWTCIVCTVGPRQITTDAYRFTTARAIP